MTAWAPMLAGRAWLAAPAANWEAISRPVGSRSGTAPWRTRAAVPQPRQVKKNAASSHQGSAEASRVAPSYMARQSTAAHTAISSRGSRVSTLVTRRAAEGSRKGTGAGAGPAVEAGERPGDVFERKQGHEAKRSPPV